MLSHYAWLFLLPKQKATIDHSERRAAPRRVNKKRRRRDCSRYCGAPRFAVYRSVLFGYEKTIPHYLRYVKSQLEKHGGVGLRGGPHNLPTASRKIRYPQSCWTLFCGAVGLIEDVQPSAVLSQYATRLTIIAIILHLVTVVKSLTACSQYATMSLLGDESRLQAV